MHIKLTKLVNLYITRGLVELPKDELPNILNKRSADNSIAMSIERTKQ